MNDYIESIKSLDEQGTSTSYDQITSGTTDVIDVSETLFPITSVDLKAEEQISVEELAPYMTPQKVTVRKYRLKK